MFALEHQALIDLIHHDPQVMGDGQVGDRLQLFAVEHHASGIVGIGKENRPGAGSNGLGQHCRVEAEIVARRTGHPHQRGAGGLEGGFVSHVHRIEGNHLVAGTEQAHRRNEQRILRTGHRNHV